MAMHVELQATCSALGYQDGKSYVKEPDCLETVKDLIRFLKREDESCDIRRQLGNAQIVQKDLLPILRQYKDESSLWETVIRLLVNLTQPGVLCFNGFVPEDKERRKTYLEVESYLQAMKEAFINEEVFAVITDRLGELLKLDWEHRQEEDRLLIERLLILVRNVLHIPPNPDAEQRTDDDASIHDQIVWAMHVSGLEDILLYIASSEEERNLSMHILEIVSLIFREQTPEMLATAGVQRSISEKQKDERELEMVREQERLQKKANLMKYSTRHSRFGGTYVVKNFKSISENDLIYHKSQNDTSKINLDMNKRPKKKSKNRKPIIERDVVRRSTLSIRLSLKAFCEQFLENCYNPLMYAVKDVLNREKSQEHDETYYLWAMRFFMEFCRHHSKQVDLVSETMSVQTCHYIQVQMFEYYEMQTMEKKEAIVWGKRVHLALKAYQELLLTLDSMDTSGNPNLIESSKVIKSNIFYTMEFRDIFLTLLRHFNEGKQSRSYLKDLVETTHLFLKMLQKFSQKTHLVVEKKKKKKKKARKPQASEGPREPTAPELEDMWEEISSELSAIFQGRAEIPDDVTPFDAASEVDVDQQRLEAMVRIQDSLRGQRAGEAVALFRAAREVWPERNEFGTSDISPEDEFMALREVFMTSLPRPSSEIIGVPEAVEEEEDEVEEEMSTMVTSEQEFVFRDFAVKFAKPDIMKPYVLLLADFQKNSTHTNHCCVKMLHRVAYELGYTGMMFQASLFRVFQRILLSPLARAERYKEIMKFATYVVRKFVEVAQKNNKIFMELLFWKTAKDSIEIVEGYGSYHGTSKVAWTEDAEVEVRRLFEEYRENEDDGKDAVDCIMDHITDPSKTRPQVIRELKKQQLIGSVKELKKSKSGGSKRPGPWKDWEELELMDLYEKCKDANDPVGSIIEEMCQKRSRPVVMDKLLSLGLVTDRKDLYKRRGKSGDKAGTRRKTRSGYDSEGDDLQELPSDFEEDGVGRVASDGSSDGGVSGSESSSDDGGSVDEAGDSGSRHTMAGVITNIVNKGYKDQIAWIQRLLLRTANDREEDGESVPVPIVPLTEDNETAMEDEVFLSFLTKIGLAAPANEQEAFWRIPWTLSPLDLRNIVAGLALDENNQPVAADRIQMKTAEKKTKRRKHREKKEKRGAGETEQRPKKNANKFAMLKELVKKKAEAKKTKRNRKKLVSRADDSSDDEAGNHPTGSSNGAGALEDVDSGSHEQTSSSKKKRRLKAFLKSDSDSSDNELPLTSLKTTNADQSASEEEEVTGTQSGDEAGTQSGEEGGTQSGDGGTQSGNEAGTQSGDEAGTQSGDEGGTQSGEENQSQLSQSQPLLFLSSSDESDQEQDASGKEAANRKLPDDSDEEVRNQSSKRSRSPDTSGEGKGQRKKARILDSDSEEDAGSITETFPATLYTQGPDSDPELDDHVPLGQVIRRKNMIESDEDE